jgi:hypothetical protein
MYLPSNLNHDRLIVVCDEERIQPMRIFNLFHRASALRSIVLKDAAKGHAIPADSFPSSIIEKMERCGIDVDSFIQILGSFEDRVVGLLLSHK